MSAGRHRRRRVMATRVLVVSLVLAFGAACGGGDGKAAPPALPARALAVGLPGAGPVTSVGRYLPGGPINDNASFKAFTEPGRMLDPNRILVGTASNFGAPMAVPDEMPGSILSIDPSAPGILTVPAGFAAAGGQATALGGKVQLYSGQTS